MPSSPLVDIIIVHDPVKVWATTSPPPASQPPIPLTPHSSTPCSWAHSHTLTVSCAMHATGGSLGFLYLHAWSSEAGLAQLQPEVEQELSTSAIAVSSAVLRKCTQGSGSGV